MREEIEVFFDGECPLCVKEIRALRWMDRKHKIRFTDISAPDFDPKAFGIPWQEFMSKIYARLPDGSWLTGVEVFRRLYSAVGFGPLVSLTRLPGISNALDFGYEKFAKNRLKWTGRCDENGCAVPRHPSHS
ncbi:MAG: DUF393 domain-containing protein [Polyangiaceae bacterium]|nr:DUF393 domain-containing protein [Polyangiaceae bacterium]